MPRSTFLSFSHRDVMIWEIVLRYAISTWVKKRIPSCGIHAWYVRRIYRCRTFGFIHSCPRLSRRAARTVSPWLEEHLVARVSENARTLPDEICVSYFVRIRRQEVINELLILFHVKTFISERHFENFINIGFIVPVYISILHSVVYQTYDLLK